MERKQNSDRTYDDLGRARLAMGSIAHPAAHMPLYAKLFDLCHNRNTAAWCNQRWMVGGKAAIALPPMGRSRP